MAGAAQWKLRRLAPRALRVMVRRAPESSALASFESTLVPVARDFIASCDGVKRFNAKWQCSSLVDEIGTARETAMRWSGYLKSLHVVALCAIGSCVCCKGATSPISSTSNEPDEGAEAGPSFLPEGGVVSEAGATSAGGTGEVPDSSVAPDEAGAKDAGHDPYSELPQERLELVREITLDGFTGEAEDLYLEAEPERMLVVTLAGNQYFDHGGALLAIPAGPPAAGVDGVGPDRGRWLTFTRDNVIISRADGVGELVEFLEGMHSATGVAVTPFSEPTAPELFVTDSARSTVGEYWDSGSLVRELHLPGTDLQGLTFFPERVLFALDAKRKRLLRLNAEFSEVVSTAPLPDALGTASGVHFFEGEVYVCFRDRASVAVLKYRT